MAAGVDGIIVSNHGERQLDVDGGIRRGGDVLRILRLELGNAMALCGCRTVAEITSALVRSA
jgi:isopentenyl diphosphate isomerase/L-lactate dehydrogenase-like FMN-dependent dehydrogenase